MVNQLSNMCDIHPCGSHVDTRKSTSETSISIAHAARQNISIIIFGTAIIVNFKTLKPVSFQWSILLPVCSSFSRFIKWTLIENGAKCRKNQPAVFSVQSYKIFPYWSLGLLSPSIIRANVAKNRTFQNMVTKAKKQFGSYSQVR